MLILELIFFFFCIPLSVTYMSRATRVLGGVQFGVEFKVSVFLGILFIICNILLNKDLDL